MDIPYKLVSIVTGITMVGEDGAVLTALTPDPSDPKGSHLQLACSMPRELGAKFHIGDTIDVTISLTQEALSKRLATSLVAMDPSTAIISPKVGNE